MPELPEVETIKRGLQKHLVGCVITGVEVLFPKIISGDVQAVVGAAVVAVRRFGKGLVIDLDNGYSMAVHVKMTGRLVYVEVPRVPQAFPKHTHVVFKLKATKSVIPSEVKRSRGIFAHSAAQVEEIPPLPAVGRDDNPQVFLYYNDVRRFGWIKVLKTEDVLNLPFFKSLGLEAPFAKASEGQASLTLKQFKHLLAGSKTPIKTLLMDQQKIAGVGNIYACDALFHAGIHPVRASSSLSKNEAGKLFASIEEILSKSIAVGGASANNYVNALGEKGTYQEHFLVYKKEGEPCRNCTNLILRVKTAGRSIFFCPECQT